MSGLRPRIRPQDRTGEDRTYRIRTGKDRNSKRSGVLEYIGGSGRDMKSVKCFLKKTKSL